ncbi:uncharacterized protein N7484_004935 [Penicillium longicatenatum]|uniref:uncharacterized protein n=1 Tax=Penicillium longicatenatum TaxID=1561947 RepID=UPI002547BBBE|nr:uncharacterized protein N7484_004935 [Penicillium longicatenatum]KAJ5651212.1 hypothetical protein N7484_004935 [Penicillium longicatenatum]
MAQEIPDWNILFNDDKFIKAYRLGERATVQFAQLLIGQSGIVAYSKSHQDRPLVVLDNACGTGVVSSILQRELDEHVRAKWQLTCGDLSEGMLEYTRRRVESEKWLNVEVKTVDAQDTKLPSEHFSHVFTAFAFMALPKGLDALNESTRILQPGGTIAFTTWIEPSWLRDAGKAIATISNDLPWPTAEEFLGMIGQGQWNSVTWIESQLRDRDYRDIKVNVVTKYNTLSVAEFVEMTMFMMPLVMKCCWSEALQEENRDKVKPALEKYLAGAYGEKGEVPGEWIAILSTAQKPAECQVLDDMATC